MKNLVEDLRKWGHLRGDDWLKTLDDDAKRIFALHENVVMRLRTESSFIRQDLRSQQLQIARELLKDLQDIIRQRFWDIQQAAKHRSGPATRRKSGLKALVSEVFAWVRAKHVNYLTKRTVKKLASTSAEANGRLQQTSERVDEIESSAAKIFDRLPEPKETPACGEVVSTFGSQLTATETTAAVLKPKQPDAKPATKDITQTQFGKKGLYIRRFLGGQLPHLPGSAKPQLNRSRLINAITITDSRNRAVKSS